MLCVEGLRFFAREKDIIIMIVVASSREKTKILEIIDCVCCCTTYTEYVFAELGHTSYKASPEEASESMGRGNLLTTTINMRIKAGMVVPRVMYQPSMGPQVKFWE